MQLGSPNVLGADQGVALKIALRGFHAHHPQTVTLQPSHRHTLHDLDAATAGRPGKAGGHQVGVGKTGFRLITDQGRIRQVGNRQQGFTLLAVQQLHFNALCLLRLECGGQRRELGAVRGGNQVATFHQASGGILIAQVAGKVGEHLPGVLGQGYVFWHRVVRAQNAAGLRGGACANLALLQHQHAFGAQLDQVIGHRAANDPSPDHDHVVVLHYQTLKKCACGQA